ncbi:hypothetical protein [Paludibaculum fermentans]|uniref:Uncharacterized protein n=1 Tax=Paludibaculum fermentans TaxID=1473598 RepID=A0A7S7NXF4_PALFE|nr:hypothetical protein [Paludibaculum fermentans]QOY91542.1 hypothetical protein IRI77_16825 [Paludibaculum fermentans]
MHHQAIRSALLAALAWCVCPVFGQAIEFESNGLRYQTLTRSGVTVMFAPLPANLKEYAVLQVAISNGSPSARTVKPDDFRFERADGTVLPATPARNVVQQFLQRGGRNDVIKLVGTYELGLYGLSRFQSTNGYEQRRQAALAEVNSSKIKAAAAASAIVLVSTRLMAGESTDGALFFQTQGRPLGAGKLTAIIGAERYEFEIGGLKHPGELMQRP